MPALSRVDKYLASLPDDQKAALQRLRDIIHQIVPEAEEKISYGMPMFFHHGMLAGFAAYKDHCSFFPGAIVERFADELVRFKTSKGTIQFTPEKPMPAALIKKIVKARVIENEVASAQKAKKYATKSR